MNLKNILHKPKLKFSDFIRVKDKEFKFYKIKRF